MKQVIKTITVVSIFAIAMAYLESAIVVYLRDIYDIKNLLTDLPTKPDNYTLIEIGRELFTLVMLATVGWIAGQKWADRIGFAAIAFGIWDIFYYLWLAVFIGWPESLFEWDILFLIPLPWWGPVYSPLLIAVLMIAGGAIAVFKTTKGIAIKLSVVDWCIFSFSILLALFVFMKDAVYVFPQGTEAVAKVRPANFNLPLYVIALAGMVFYTFRIFQQSKKN